MVYWKKDSLTFGKPLNEEDLKWKGSSIQGYAKVFPNPAQDHLIINVGQKNDDIVTYRIINGKGQIIKEGQTSSRIGTDDLENGLYIINLTLNGQRYFEKFQVFK